MSFPYLRGEKRGEGEKSYTSCIMASTRVQDFSSHPQHRPLPLIEMTFFENSGTHSPTGGVCQILINNAPTFCNTLLTMLLLSHFDSA
ncbi:MAG: hypothetical protein JWR38_2333 [Mucilaginibacter sp.]|nr:hypothetical protein [Mucilaginibacter sp.]